MKRVYVGLFPLLLLLSCHRRQDDPQADLVIPAVLATIPQKLSATDPSLADRPQFGDANTVRQAPYGFSPKRADQTRLQSVLFNGQLQTAYKYDDQGHLIEKIGYYKDGHISRSTRFSYEPTGAIRVEYWPNKNDIIGAGGGYPPNNDLILNSITTFATTNSSAELVKTNQRGPANFNVNYPQEYRFGFNPSGQLVWVEEPNPYGLSGDYTLYVRNELGNIVQTKNVWLVQSEQNLTTLYQYDQRPNPYYTTGDLTDDRATNGNNILVEETKLSTSKSRKTSYSYEYRPDGYPGKVTYVLPQGDPITLEFIYNK